ncbi:hypothetical protein EJ08DRAFT_138265 [Tothia fuscella]|uniref:Uncharacterized protein n=1 Tax=Tothia fuscella TaxID=1048955 RepID=A0A9P4U088_9PEZI|nr:hypothetical protein EJ08DRAFT_138265 [Tothia fuscella]
MSEEDDAARKSDNDDKKNTLHRMSPADAEELRKLDAVVDRICKAIPEHPYILSVPCDEPRYHYPSQQEAESWQKNTPFTLDEERLQYMTFVFRDPTELSCFVIRSQADEERDQLAQLKKLKGPKSSAAPPVKQSVPKKKISFNDYKDKKAGKITSPQNIHSTMETKDGKLVNNLTADQKSVKATESLQPSDLTGPKRSRNASESLKSSYAAPPVKKPRTLTTAPDEPSLLSQMHFPPHDLPPILSPTFLPQLSDNDSWLPPMLSPTLPPNIEAALAKEKSPRSRADSNASSSSANDKKLKKPPTSSATSSKPSSQERIDKQGTPKLSTKPVPALGAISNMRKEAMARSESPIRKVSDELKIKKKDDDEASSRPKLPKVSPAEEELPEKLVVKLKYGRKNKMQIERYLKLPPRPTRDPAKLAHLQSLKVDHGEGSRVRSSSTASQQRVEPSIKSKEAATLTRDPAKKTLLPSERPSKSSSTPDKVEKRSRQDDNEHAPAPKRQKIPANLDIDKNPKTPNRAPLISPSFQKSGGSMKSNAHLTPRADHLKSTAMSRSISNETPVATPGGKPPNPTPLPRGEKGPTSVPVNGKAAESHVLNKLSQHFNNLGRKLKHANQAITSKSRDQITDADRKKAACLGLECILSYMLAYALVDAARKIDRRSAEIDSTWVTLLPLFKHLGISTRAFQHLEGLRYHLGIAICARIQAVCADRSSRSSTSSSAPQPPISQTQSQDVVGGRDKSDSPNDPFSSSTPASASAITKNQEISGENFKFLLEFSREASSKLSIEDIISGFPKTWGKKATGLRESGVETLLRDGIADCKGKFWLPIGIDTQPVQAVRFGLQALGEWVKKEGLVYEVQVKL